MLIEVICEKRERGRGGGRTESREEVVIIHPITITTTINNNDNTLAIDEINLNGARDGSKEALYSHKGL